MPDTSTKLKPVPTRAEAPEATASLWALARLALGLASLGTAWLGTRTAVRDPGQPSPPSADHTLRYAAVGLMGELEKLSGRASSGLDQALRPRALPPAGPSTSRRIVPRGPLGREFDRMEARGRLEVARLEERGKLELTRLVAAGQEQERAARSFSEEVVRDAISDVVEEVVQLSVVRVAESTAVREVIHTESSGLMEEFVDDMRGRLVRADALAEGGVHRALHLGSANGSHASSSGQTAAEPLPAGEAGRPELTRGSSMQRPAGIISRFAALAIDAWLLTVGLASGAYVVSTALAFARLETSVRESSTTALAYGGVMTLLVVVYLTVCWSAFGRTPGKAALGLKVMRRDGGELSVARSLVRVLGYLLSALPLYLGFAWVLVDSNRRPWHDHLAGTQVVYTSRKYGR